jgi:pimeloyl-ACP methyl ester carboxylesterase
MSFDAPRGSDISHIAHKQMEASKGHSLWSVRNAKEAAGKFPIVIYAPSFSNMSWENADLCEYLASQGYVVVATPALGEHTRDMTSDVAGVSTQARDISFLVGYAQTLSNTNPAEVAVVGFSWGGISNLFAAARDDRIKALVALDGSLRYWGDLVKAAGDIHPEQMTLPLLYFAQRDMNVERVERAPGLREHAPGVLNRWVHGDLIMVHMLGMNHGDFASMFQRSSAYMLDNHDPLYPSSLANSDYSVADEIVGYGWVARYTLAFLDAYLKQDARGMTFLKNTLAANRVPSHTMDVAYRAASGRPVSMEEFRRAVGRKDLAHLEEVYAQYRKEHADFELTPALLSSWSGELLDEDYGAEAILVLQFKVKLHDDSGALDELAFAYEKTGDEARAIQTYQAALDKDPSDVTARSKLNRLKPH